MDGGDDKAKDLIHNVLDTFRGSYVSKVTFFLEDDEYEEKRRERVRVQNKRRNERNK